MKIKTIIMSFAIAAIGILASCCSKKNVASLNDLEGRWSIEKIAEGTVNIDDPEGAWLNFDIGEHNVSGKAGCNVIMATFEPVTQAGKIDFINIASSRMMCHDMTTETALLQALNDVRSYTLKDGVLNLKNSAGKTIIELKRPTIGAK